MSFDCQKTCTNPFWKNANLPAFIVFIGLKRFVFFLELYQTLFLEPFSIKKMEKSQFLTKIMD